MEASIYLVRKVVGVDDGVAYHNEASLAGRKGDVAVAGRLNNQVVVLGAHCGSALDDVVPLVTVSVQGVSGGGCGLGAGSGVGAD